MKPTIAQLAMVEEHQCPGCSLGCSPADGCLKFDADDYGYRCVAHSAGTFASGGVGRLNLGLPKGFCRVVYSEAKGPRTNVILFDKTPAYDRLNVPVWAMERDGNLYVRVYMPRTDQTRVHVVAGGKLSDVPDAINVGEFIDEID